MQSEGGMLGFMEDELFAKVFSLIRMKVGGLKTIQWVGSGIIQSQVGDRGIAGDNLSLAL